MSMLFSRKQRSSYGMKLLCSTATVQRPSIDHTIHDLFKNPKPFGGITMLFVSDFCQTLPVVPRGSRAQIINAPLRRSMLWRDIEVCHLIKNMHLDCTPESEAFA